MDVQHADSVNCTGCIYSRRSDRVSGDSFQWTDIYGKWLHVQHTDDNQCCGAEYWAKHRRTDSHHNWKCVTFCDHRITFTEPCLSAGLGANDIISVTLCDLPALNITWVSLTAITLFSPASSNFSGSDPGTVTVTSISYGTGNRTGSYAYRPRTCVLSYVLFPSM